MKRRVMSGFFEMASILYQYTGNYQTFTAPGTGWYKIECWGAQGCYGGSYGGYTSGTIKLTRGTVLYIYCGHGGTNDYMSAFNGGGNGGIVQVDGNRLGAGGGATDVRLTLGLWNNMSSLLSRIMVAAGGAGGAGWTSISKLIGTAGGLTGYHTGNIYGSSSVRAGVGTQTTGGAGMQDETTGAWAYGLSGSFGKGGDGGISYSGGGSGAGSGYYGGGGGGTRISLIGSGGGGSSFISGHAGCDAVNSSGAHTGQANHYSSKVFKDTIMIDGAGYQWTSVKGSLLLMPKPTGGTYASGVGHSGTGCCRISKAK